MKIVRKILTFIRELGHEPELPDVIKIPRAPISSFCFSFEKSASSSDTILTVHFFKNEYARYYPLEATDQIMNCASILDLSPDTPINIIKKLLPVIESSVNQLLFVKG